MNARAGVGCDTVAIREEKATSDNFDVSVGPDRGIEICDAPRSGRVDAAYDVEFECEVRVLTDDIDDSDASPKAERVARGLCGGDAGGGQRQKPEDYGAAEIPDSVSCPKICHAIVTHYRFSLMLLCVCRHARRYPGTCCGSSSVE